MLVPLPTGSWRTRYQLFDYTVGFRWGGILGQGRLKWSMSRHLPLAHPARR